MLRQRGCAYGLKSAVTGFNYDPPAVGQGVARIEPQIEDELLGLRLIDFYQAQIRTQPEFKLDVLADEAGQQIPHVLSNLIQAQGTDLARFRPGKNQQLAH